MADPQWGDPPWQIDFRPREQALPAEIDFAVVGAGFTGLAAAASLQSLAPEKSVVVLEAGGIGAGASSRTGGIVLAETAAGDLPGLGDVLKGFRRILDEFGVDCGLHLCGAWEIGRQKALPDSPIDWNDSGHLRVVKEVPGGTLDPGRLVSGLARAAETAGASIHENCRVEEIRWGENPELRSGKHCLRAGKVLFATNALSLDLAGLDRGMHPRLTLAATTAPVSGAELAAIGLSQRKPFYTVDLPYLWGRPRDDNSIIWGAGLVSSPDERNLEVVDVARDESSRMFAALEKRVRGLHPALGEVRFMRRWGGPILFRDSRTPVFDWHPRSPHALVLGAFAGHGVALTSYLGRWAAEILLGKRDLPGWGAIRD